MYQRTIIIPNDKKEIEKFLEKANGFSEMQIVLSQDNNPTVTVNAKNIMNYHLLNYSKPARLIFYYSYMYGKFTQNNYEQYCSMIDYVFSEYYISKNK